MKHLTNRNMEENRIATAVQDECYQVYFTYGPGLFERVYEACLVARLEDRGFRVERQKTIYIYDEYVINEPGFIADLIVNDCVIIELKSVESLKNVHRKQLTTYLKLTGLRLGLLVNFNTVFLKDNIIRIANGMPR